MSKLASQGDHVVGAIGRDVRESTGHLGIVALSGCILWHVVFEVRCESKSSLLVGWNGEHVAEATG